MKGLARRRKRQGVAMGHSTREDERWRQSMRSEKTSVVNRKRVRRFWMGRPGGGA